MNKRLSTHSGPRQLCLSVTVLPASEKLHSLLTLDAGTAKMHLATLAKMV
jgi:hypothetical protein